MYAVALFMLMSVFLLVQHEISLIRHGRQTAPLSTSSGNSMKEGLHELFRKRNIIRKEIEKKTEQNSKAGKPNVPSTIAFRKENHHEIVHELDADQLHLARARESEKEAAGADALHLQEKELEFSEEEQKEEEKLHPEERKGLLTCNGSLTDSEVIYWKIVPGDNTYESPITPHHGDHHDKYLTFEYDAGGWNNVRMGMECLLVVAHATGRTLVIPPQQHLYLLGQTHKDKEDKEAHDEMGFEDFFGLDLLRSHEVAVLFCSILVCMIIVIKKHHQVKYNIF